jgi:hypothetical protein
MQLNMYMYMCKQGTAVRRHACVITAKQQPSRQHQLGRVCLGLVTSIHASSHDRRVKSIQTFMCLTTNGTEAMALHE